MITFFLALILLVAGFLPMADWLNGFPGSMIGKHPLSLIPMALTTFL